MVCSEQENPNNPRPCVGCQVGIMDNLRRPGPTIWASFAMSGAAFKPDSILTQAKNNNAAGIRALVEAGVPVEFCNQVGRSTPRPAITGWGHSISRRWGAEGVDQPYLP